MGYYLIIGGSAIILGLLIWLILRIRVSSDETSAVPIQDLTEIKNLNPNKSSLSISNPVATIAEKKPIISEHIIRENQAKPQNISSENAVSEEKSHGLTEEKQKNDLLAQEIAALKENLLQQSKEYQLSIEKLQQDNERLQEALRREVSSKDTKTLSEEEMKRLQESELQLKNLRVTIEGLTSDNTKLREQSASLNAEVQKLSIQLDESTKEQNELTAQLNKQIVDLNNEILSYKQNTEILSQLQAKNIELEKIVKDLNREVENRTNELTQLHGEISKVTQESMSEHGQLQLTIAKLKTHITTLENLNKEKDTQLNQFADDMSVVRARYEQKLAEFEAKQLEPVVNVPSHNEDFARTTLEMAQLQQKVDTLLIENQKFLLLKEEVEKNFEKVKEYNQFLLEKEKILQYELSKSRAQALGLERICEDLKIQIESPKATL